MGLRSSRVAKWFVSQLTDQLLITGARPLRETAVGRVNACGEIRGKVRLVTGEECQELALGRMH